MEKRQGVPYLMNTKSFQRFLENSFYLSYVEYGSEMRNKWGL